MKVGLRIDRYTVQGVLGHGGTSNVYRAWDPKLHREVAIKVVFRDAAGHGRARARFHREARAIAALKHPNIVVIHDYSGPDSDMLYLVTELIEGRDVHTLLTEYGPVPETVALSCGIEICRALEAAHAAGVIHRDVKPENTFLDERGGVVLTDFGGVKSFEEDTALADSVSLTDIIGTPGFMPPEQLRGGKLGPHTDIFGLGATLYNMCTGHLPRRVQIFTYEDPAKYGVRLTPEFCTVMKRCAHTKPEKRFPTVNALRLMLQEILAQHSPEDPRDILANFASHPRNFVDPTRLDAQPVARRVVGGAYHKPRRWRTVAVAAVVLTLATTSVLFAPCLAKLLQSWGVPVSDLCQLIGKRR